jgi:cyclic-di-GMP-binding biofilm dispersal mediator protein
MFTVGVVSNVMTLFTGKHILVIGANGAFGKEFCDQLMARGARVSGTARNVESSVRLCADLHQRLILDLESPASIEQLTDFLRSQTESIDGIVLAAGLVAFGTMSETPASVVSRLMQVNAIGQIQVVSRLLEKLSSSSQDPFVVSISGVISEVPMSGLAAYSASKTAIAGYATAAAKELRKAGVNWIDARPGHTESGLADRAIFGTAPNFGAGKSVESVVVRIIDGIANKEKDLSSASF